MLVFFGLVYVKTDEAENIYNFTLKTFVCFDLCGKLKWLI